MKRESKTRKAAKAHGVVLDAQLAVATEMRKFSHSRSFASKIKLSQRALQDKVKHLRLKALHALSEFLTPA